MNNPAIKRQEHDPPHPDSENAFIAHETQEDTNKDRKLKQLEQLLGGDPKQVLEDLYLKQRLLPKDIAHRFHKTPMSVSRWFKRFGIVLKEAEAHHDNAV